MSEASREREKDFMISQISEPKLCDLRFSQIKKQVAQWAMIAHLGASIMFGDTIIYDAQRLVTLNLKQ